MTDPMLDIFPSPETLARQAAERITLIVGATTGPVSIALSGGSTPRRLYELLAKSPLPWDKIHWFWGDERMVPHDDPLSNFRMTQEALLNRAPIPAANIHPVPTGLGDPAATALAYQNELAGHYGSDTLDPARPLFDINLLGLGADGHTASLFPGHPALDITDRWVAAVIGAKDEARITLTFPALDSCRNAIFLVSGSEKRNALKRLLAGDKSIPAGRVRPASALLIFADAAASPVSS